MRSVTFRIYQEILKRDVYLTGYQSQVTLKDVVLTLTEYVLYNFTMIEGWVIREIKPLIGCWIPTITVEEMVSWCSITRKIICEELGLAEQNDVLINVKIDGELIRYSYLRLEQ